MVSTSGSSGIKTSWHRPSYSSLEKSSNKKNLFLATQWDYDGSMVNIVYLGPDARYFKNLEKRFLKEFPEAKFQFNQVWREDGSTSHELILDIERLDPSVLFLDYSFEVNKVLSVAENISRLFPHLNSVIGLWDPRNGDEVMLQGHLSGVPIAHIKGVEVAPPVLHAMFFLEPDKVDLEKWAKAEVYDNLVLPFIHIMKVVFVSKTHMRIEHDLMPSQSTFPLKTYFKDWPIEHYMHSKSINENLDYPYEHSSDFQLCYRPVDKKAPAGKKEKEWARIYQNDIIKMREKKVSEWLKSFVDKNSPRLTKVMIIDPELQILNQIEESLDRYPFCIRIFRKIYSAHAIQREKPGIIFYQSADEEDGGGEVIEQIKEIKNYFPFVFIFCLKSSSEELKEKLNYDKLMTHEGRFSFQQILDFCNLYEQKEGKEKTFLTEDDDHEEKIYIPKNSPESFAEYSLQARVRELSETHLKFQCKESLPKGSIYSLKWPTIMGLTIVEEIQEESWKVSGMNQYKALIHSIGEKELASLRRAVNQVIKKKN